MKSAMKSLTNAPAGESADRLLRIREVAARLNVTTRTVQLWAVQKRIPQPLKIGGAPRGATRWRERDIALYIAVGCDMNKFTAAEAAR